MNFNIIKHFSRILTKNIRILNTQHQYVQITATPKKHQEEKYTNKCLINEKKDKKNDNKQNSSRKIMHKAFISAFAFNLFKKKDEEDETPEEKLIMVIKRSILCIQRGELNTAEQMLHLALRMAQDLKHTDGITYIYDVMANLAMEKDEYAKAERLFVDVMKRLFEDGKTEDSIKVLHISAKLAFLSHLQEFVDKADLGFKWTINKVEQLLKSTNDIDLEELLGLTNNWYAQFLMKENRFEEAKKCLEIALEIYTKIHGKLDVEALMLLNNLGVVCTNLNNLKIAKEYFTKAMAIAKDLPEVAELCILKANIGMLYIKEGLMNKAKEQCTSAWRLGKKLNSKEAVKQANHCLEQIK